MKCLFKIGDEYDEIDYAGAAPSVPHQYFVATNVEDGSSKDIMYLYTEDYNKDYSADVSYDLWMKYRQLYICEKSNKLFPDAEVFTYVD